MDDSLFGFSKPKRSKKEKPYEVTDFSHFTNEELASQLKNQLLTQAMKQDPQPSILVLAMKLYGEQIDEDNNEISSLSTEEIIEKLRGMI